MGLDYPNTVNLDLTSAKAILESSDIKDYKVFYRDSKKGHGSVIDQKVNRDGSLNLFVGTRSIIKNLPGNYQGNQSLQNFLMIFQHFNNDFDLKLDNLHNAFNPMKTRKEFLLWLSSWFSLEIGADLPEVRYRRLIREIVPLYRWRGTRHGMQRILEIISGYKPEIIEGDFENSIEESESISFTFSETGGAESVIGINFPVSQKVLGGRVVKTIYNIVEKEKPAHIRCRIMFRPDVVESDVNSFTIGEVAVVEDSRL